MMMKKFLVPFIVLVIGLSIIISWQTNGQTRRAKRQVQGYQKEPPRPELEPRIMVGKPVPDFEVTLLDGKEKVSNQSLKGKFYLLDFWATWCGPCVGEMANLHNAYQKFKDKNFVMISLSVDHNIESLHNFRQGQWKMPWLHAYMMNEANRKMLEAFEVKSIPMPILVGFDGRIIATEYSLRGDQLEKTLADFLK